VRTLFQGNLYSKMKIKTIKTRWILDSLGKPTVEVDIYLENGSYGRASVPTGISTSISEASELWDKRKEFKGYGVSHALNIVEHSVAPLITGIKADNQEAIDAKLIALDSTPNKTVIGSNVCLAVSVAVAKAAAQAGKLPLYAYLAQLAGIKEKDIRLPIPMIAVLGGGLHARKTMDFESLMIIPTKARDIHTAIRVGIEINYCLKEVLLKRNFALVRATDGSFAPVGARSNKQAIELVCEATKQAGYIIGEDVWLGIGMAASHLYQKGVYTLGSDKVQLGPRAYSEWIDQLLKKYPIKLIEDPFYEESWQSWTKLTEQAGKKVQIVGNDLIATSEKLLQKAIKARAANAILIKPNQIGTLSETISTYKEAKKAGWQTFVASRAGETKDSYLAHLAVGLGSEQTKLGAAAGSSSSEYNELLRISDSLGSDLFRRLV